MDRRKFLAAIGGAATVVTAGCGGDDGGTETPTGEVVQSIELTGGITGEFDPTTTSIETGEAVEWVNNTDEDRRIVPDSNVNGAEQWSFGSEEASTMESGGGTVTRTFNQAGVHVFVDELSTRFQTCGAVAVGDASLDDMSLPCE